ncbi:MAG: hypothetical protein ABSG69_15375, partial [Candidatus Acidiferrum sp.]
MTQLGALRMRTFYGTLDTTFEEKRTSVPAGLQLGRVASGSDAFFQRNFHRFTNIFAYREEQI